VARALVTDAEGPEFNAQQDFSKSLSIRPAVNGSPFSSELGKVKAVAGTSWHSNSHSPDGSYGLWDNLYLKKILFLRIARTGEKH